MNELVRIKINTITMSILYATSIINVILYNLNTLQIKYVILTLLYLIASICMIPSSYLFYKSYLQKTKNMI